MWYGQFTKAIELADQNSKIAKDRSPAWYWRFQILKAQASVFQDDNRKALGLLEPEVPAKVSADVRARKRIAQADVLCRTGKPEQAKPILDEVESLVPGEAPLIKAELALAQGRCVPHGNQQAAEKYFYAASKLSHGNDEFIEGTGLLNLGFTMIGEAHYDDAIAVLSDGLKVTQSPVLGNRMLGNLGFAYSQLGDWRRGISFSEAAIKLAEGIENKEGAQERWLIDLGKAHFALREFAEAETDYLKALSIAQQLHDQANTALCFHNLTLLALRRHDIARADEYLRQGEALKIEQQALHFAFDEAKIAAERKQFPEAERLFQELVPRSGKDAVLRSMVQRDLGTVYWHENKNAKADQMFRQGIATAEKALAELKRPEDRMSFMDQTPFYDAYIQFLVGQKRHEDALMIAERSRARVLAAALSNGKASDPEISIERLRTLARQRKETVLTYFLTDQSTFLWVITDSGFKLFKLPGQNELFPQTVSFNREIQDHRDPENSPAAMNLYRALLEPAGKLIRPGSSIVIIPSKLLSLVNFEALVVPAQKPHYWIEEVDVQLTGSLALLAGARSPHSAGKSKKTLLAIGAPVEATKDFPALKFAPTEMQLVQKHFPAAERVVVSGKDATPQAYGSNNPGQFRFVHLDTHGVASDLNPLDSAIILSPGPGNSYKLHAQEIKDIPLHADLVTISSCYGAGTRWYQGEGIVGLGWAFLRAGAHQVIAALWEVDDASSPKLMDDFYGELTNGKSAAEALRDAKLKMLHSSDFHRHPFYWASLQLYSGS